MQVLSFTLIEDSRFPDHPTLEALKKNTSDALQMFGSEIDYYIRNERILDFKDGTIQKRADVEVEYTKGNKIKSCIIARINEDVYPMVYRINGKVI